MPAMATEPPARLALRWEAIYPLLDRLFPEREDWLDITHQLEVMEAAALNPAYNPLADAPAEP